MMIRPPTAPERRLLPEGRLAGPMPWVIAIMMFLTVLAAAGGLGLAHAARGLTARLAGGITIQIVDANPDRREAAARVVVARLAADPHVVHVHRVGAEEMARRLPYLFASLNKLGTTIIVATHDLHLLTEVTGAEMLRLDRGQIADPTGALRHPPRRAEL